MNQPWDSLSQADSENHLSRVAKDSEAFKPFNDQIATAQKEFPAATLQSSI